MKTELILVRWNLCFAKFGFWLKKKQPESTWIYKHTKKRIDQANDFKLSEALVAHVHDRIIYLLSVVEIIIY